MLREVKKKDVVNFVLAITRKIILIELRSRKQSCWNNI
jgi:hypothetical protein